MKMHFLVLLILGFQNLLIAGNPAAPDTAINAKIEYLAEDAQISIAATCYNRTALRFALTYQFATFKNGPNGHSQTNQSNQISLPPLQKQVLSAVNLKITARDTIISSLHIFNTDKLIAADSLVYVSGDSTAIKLWENVYRR